MTTLNSQWATECFYKNEGEARHAIVEGLKKALKKKGITSQELAGRSGMPIEDVECALAHGRGTVKTLLHLTDKLDVSLWDILGLKKIGETERMNLERHMIEDQVGLVAGCPSGEDSGAGNQDVALFAFLSLRIIDELEYLSRATA